MWHLLAWQQDKAVKKFLDLFCFYAICVTMLIFPPKMYNKTMIGLCDMQNYQCLGKSYKPRRIQKPHPIIDIRGPYVTPELNNELQCNVGNMVKICMHLKPCDVSTSKLYCLLSLFLLQLASKPSVCEQGSSSTFM